MREKEYRAEILRMQKAGHTLHCACRIATGDGECECGKKDHIPGGISKLMYKNVCYVCLAKKGQEHKEWCRNAKV